MMISFSFPPKIITPTLICGQQINHHVLKLPLFSKIMLFYLSTWEMVVFTPGPPISCSVWGSWSCSNNVPIFSFYPSWWTPFLREWLQHVGMPKGASSGPCPYSLIFSLTLDLQFESLQNTLMCLFCKLPVRSSYT